MSPIRAHIAENMEHTEEQKKLYSKIQQLLMDAVLRLKNGGNNKHAISAQHFAATIRTLTAILQSHTNVHSTSRDLAMERLAQAVSAAMSANCIYGNKRSYHNLSCIYRCLVYEESTIKLCVSFHRGITGTAATSIVSALSN